MKSIWTDSTALPKFEQLNGNINTEVLIIGGGMAGMLCAHALQEKGIDYILVEAKSVLSGITCNTTAKVTSQHGLIYSQLIKDLGIDQAILYKKANEGAIKKYETLCKTIDCDFEKKASYVYSMDDENKIREEVRAIERMGFNTEFTKDIVLPFSIAGAIKIKDQAQFNPMKFAAKLVHGLNIYENTVVREVSEHTAKTDLGTITAKKIIVATHFPFINKHGSYFLKMYQHRSYVIALENGQDVNGMYVDEAEKGMSFRNYNSLLLIGGGDHRTGKKGGGWQELRNFAKKYYPNSRELYSWATQDCMTLDQIPYIGLYSKRTPDFYVATGFNKWGMTTSMVAADVLADMVSGVENKYEELFSPRRSMIKPQLVVNGYEAVINLLTISKKRCPHLGCALKWNQYEHSWDCPCHGSRFSEDGGLIDNPATGDLKAKN